MSYHEDVIPVDLSAVSPAKTKKSKSLMPWAIIDATGQTTVVELDKYAIMRRVHISVRDLRILDRDSSYPCTILGRERAIVLHLEPIKMIITAEEVYLRDPKEKYVLLLQDELRRRLSVENKAGCGQGDGEEILDAQSDADDEDESPFEFRALEVALEAIYSLLEVRTIELETSVYPALDELTSKIGNRNLDRVRQLKRRTTPLTARVQKVRDALERLMENDDDLAELCLSGKLARTTSQLSGEPISNPTPRTIGRKFSRAKRVSFGTGRGDEDDVEELEMLLEPYFFRINNVMIKLSTLQEYIDDTEDYINIKLDSVRNQLIKFDVILSSASICVSVYSLVAGILGMNIPNSWNNHRYMFKWVVSVTGTLCGILFVIIMLYARYQRLVGF